MPDSSIEVLRKETYLKLIENSPGTKMFSSVFVRFKNTGEVKDVLNNGNFSCAAFTSSVLFLSGAISRTTTTVDSLRKLIEEDTENWMKVGGAQGGAGEAGLNQIEPGDVIFWNKIKYDDGSEHAHVGFAVTRDEAVSTDSKNKMVARHPINQRPIDGIYRFGW